MKCSKCGNEIEKTDKFCKFCGNNVSQSISIQPNSQVKPNFYTQPVSYWSITSLIFAVIAWIMVLAADTEGMIRSGTSGLFCVVFVLCIAFAIAFAIEALRVDTKAKKSFIVLSFISLSLIGVLLLIFSFASSLLPLFLS